MRAVIARNQQNSARIFPYIGGDEVNSRPTHHHHRFIIDFFDRPLCRKSDLKPWADMTKAEQEKCLTIGLVPDDYSGETAADWPDLLDIVRRRVKPEREVQKREVRRRRWWQYAEKSPRLYAAVTPLKRVLVRSLTSAHFSTFTFLPTGIVYDQTLIVFASSDHRAFCCLASSGHETWTRFLGATLEDRGRYNIEDCFETFPFPANFETSVALETSGRTYHDHRAALMVARDEGMTKTYNRFNDRSEQSDDIRRLRDLHSVMDRVVLEAYGWHDLAERAAPVFLDETNEDDHTYQDRLFWPSDFRDEVLARLLALNAERHAEEVRLGIAPGLKGKAETNDGGDDEMELE
jgi:hypothetical protein